MIWDVEDIELAIAIVLADMAQTTREKRISAVKKHDVTCYAMTQGDEQRGFCVARALGEYQLPTGQKAVVILYPLYITFRIYDDTFEIHYYDMIFKRSAKELAVEVEKLKSQLTYQS